MKKPIEFFWKIDNYQALVNVQDAFATCEELLLPPLTAKGLTNLILSGNTQLSQSLSTIDKRLDPDIEQLVVVLLDAINQIRTVYPEFRAQREAIRKSLLDDVKKNIIYYNEKYIHIPRFSDTQVFRSLFGHIEETKGQPRFVPTYMSGRRQKKISPIDIQIWNRFLECNRHKRLGCGLSPYRINEGIKAAYDAWYGKLDTAPEQLLRAGFVERLEQTNWLSEALYRWRYMEDYVTQPGGEELSRQDVVTSIVEMFKQNYFEPLGIEAPVEIVVWPCDMSEKKNSNNPAFYNPQTGRIVIKVDERIYRKSVAERADLSYGALESNWNSKPDKLIGAIVEELSHQFDHEVCKKYLAGDFAVESPWNGYARALLPQFVGNPGTHLYGNSYYMLNPVERRIEGLLDQVQGVLYAAHQQAIRAAKQAEFSESSRRSTQTIASAQVPKKFFNSYTCEESLLAAEEEPIKRSVLFSNCFKVFQDVTLIDKAQLHMFKHVDLKNKFG